MQGEAGAAATTKVLLVEEAQQDFLFTEVPEKPVLSALRDFSAPVKLQVGRSTCCSDWLFGALPPTLHISHVSNADVVHHFKAEGALRLFSQDKQTIREGFSYLGV